MCGCGGKQQVKYEVTFSNGSPSQQYDTVGEAQTALATAGGGTFKAVPA